MKRRVFAGALLVFLFTCSVALPVTQIQYETADLGAGRWQYSYDVSNTSLTGMIEEFTIWFDFDLYDNLFIETPDPPASDWDEIVVQPEPVFSDNGYYDALALAGIGINLGETVSEFTVSFAWLGVGEPGPQLFEIIEPDSFETLDSGWTIPEPSTLLMLGLGAVILRRKR
jgi:hypothetical protein